MKKELLIGTALVSTLGAASVAHAGVDATMSGNHQTGLEFDSPNAGQDSRAQVNDNNFTVSLEQTTDEGITITSSFMLVNEASNGGGNGDGDAGFTLAFTGGSKLDVLNAGNASGTHDISIPGSAGAEGVTITTSNKAPTGLDFATGSTVYGVEFHTAEDFLTDGLTMSFSISTDDNKANTSTYTNTGHVAFGGTYVTDIGESNEVTLGFGYSAVEGATTGTAPNSEEGGMHMGVSIVNGDLTIAVGFADGDDIASTTASTPAVEVDGEVVKAGVKYILDEDFTLNLGITSGEGQDGAFGTAGTTEDSYDKTSASISYAVADGVTAILGYSDVDSSDEGANDTTDGSAWYIGANMSF